MKQRTRLRALLASPNEGIPPTRTNTTGWSNVEGDRTRGRGDAEANKVADGSAGGHRTRRTLGLTRASMGRVMQARTVLDALVDTVSEGSVHVSQVVSKLESVSTEYTIRGADTVVKDDTDGRRC